MAPKSTATKQEGLLEQGVNGGAAPVAPVAPGPITYFVGFERRGSNRYGIITGKVRLSDGVLFDVVVDPITQDLGETSHGVLAEFQKLAAVIP